MAFDFPPPPAAPSVGQIVTGPNGAMYSWNGTRWVAVAGPTISGFVPITGGTMTGPLGVPSTGIRYGGGNLIALHWTGSQLSASVDGTGTPGILLPISGGAMTGMLTLANDAVNPLHPVSLRQLTAASAADSVLLQQLASLIGAERLKQDTTFYVRNDGNDANTGLTNTAGGAWQTLQHAYDTINGRYNLNGYTVTIQLAPGAYAPLRAANTPAGNVLGSAGVILRGDPANPATTAINATNSNAIAAVEGARISVDGVTLSATGLVSSGGGLVSTTGALITFRNVRFNSCQQANIWTQAGGTIYIVGDYTLMGSGAQHMLAQGGTIGVAAESGTANCTQGIGLNISCFVYATMAGVILLAGWSAGPNLVNGQKAHAGWNAIISCPGGTVLNIPGSIPHSSDWGGQVITT